MLDPAMSEIDSGFSWWWTAWFFLIPFGLPLTHGLVISDLPAIALILTSIIGIIKGNAIRFSKTEACFVFFVGCSLLGAEITRVPAFYLYELSAVLFLFACFKISANFLQSKKRLEHAVRLTGNAVALHLLINTIVIASHNFLGFEFNSFFSGGEKLSWPFAFSGQLGISLTIIFPLAVCSRNFTTLQRFLLHVMFLLNTGATASRSVFWLSLCEVLYLEFVVYTQMSSVRKIFKALLLLCVVGLLIMFFGESYNFQRSLGQVETSPLLFDEPRLGTLRDALRTLPTWLQGYGLGCFKAFHELEIHNTPLSILVETGFAGFVATTMFISTIFLCFWRARKKAVILLWHGLFMSFVAVLVNAMFRNLVTSRICWFILALCYCHRHFQQEKQQAVAADSPTRELKLQPTQQ